MRYKICSGCKQRKSIDNFYKRKTGYYRSICNSCHNKINKKYKQNNREKIKNSGKQYRRINHERMWIIRTLSYHRVKGFIIKISKDELFQIMKNTKFCPYCGAKLTHCQGFTDNSASLDRINNETILNPDNVQIICWRCNVTKGPRTHNNFIEYCKNILRRFHEKI